MLRKKLKYLLTVTGMFLCMSLGVFAEDELDDVEEPVISLSGTNYVHDNGTTYFKECKVSFSDNSGKVRYARLNGKGIYNAVKNNGYYKVSKEGYYTVSVEDKSGNLSTENFAIDRSSPILSALNKDVYYANKVITFRDTKSGMDSVTLNGTPISDKDLKKGKFTLKNDGKYVIKVTDNLGNSKSVTVYMAKTGAVVSGVENDKSYRNKVKISVVANAGVSIKSIKLNNNSIKNNYTVKSNGKYKLKVTTSNGRIIKVNFIIDYKKPTINLKNNRTYAKAQKISASDELSGVDKIYLDGVEVKNKTKVSTSGKHTVKVVDKAGNSRTVKFTIK